jgi:type IV pilus assembly protein PilA
MLNRKQHQNIQGFTWIELLVVIAVIGILAAIALPSFLNKKACACVEAEAPHYVGSLLRMQQAFFLDESRFATSFSEATSRYSKGYVPPESNNYAYSINTQKGKTFVYGKSRKLSLKSYVGGVFLIEDKGKNEVRTEAIRCVAKQPGTQSIAPPIDAQTCGEGTIKVGNN